MLHDRLWSKERLRIGAGLRFLCGTGCFSLGHLDLAVCTQTDRRINGQTDRHTHIRSKRGEYTERVRGHKEKAWKRRPQEESIMAITETAHVNHPIL